MNIGGDETGGQSQAGDDGGRWRRSMLRIKKHLSGASSPSRCDWHSYNSCMRKSTRRLASPKRQRGAGGISAPRIGASLLSSPRFAAALASGGHLRVCLVPGRRWMFVHRGA